MSSPLAIAAATATLRSLLFNLIPRLDTALADLEVTTRPPDKARDGIAKAQLNLFLYQAPENAALRNMDPRPMRPGETAHPPLALNLHYLLTAYGRGDADNDAISHRVLGGAMSVLHDHPLLGAAEIKDALAGSGLHEQIERVRITRQPLSLDELSKLWMMFQTGYRSSAAYEVAVVLIESTRPSRVPLPVLARGVEDRGIHVQPNLLPPFPAIEDVRLVVVNPATGEERFESMKDRLSFELGDRIAIFGHHFAGDDEDKTKVTVTVRLSSPHRDKPLDVLVPVADRTDRRIILQIPNDPAKVPVGLYALWVVVEPNGKPDKKRETTESSLLIAPKITSAMPMTVARTNVVEGLGNATINLTCSPQVQVEQRVTLALGDREFHAKPRTAQTGSLLFVANGIGAGDFRVRLRVGRVDSHFVDFSDPQQPKFNDKLKVTIT